MKKREKRHLRLVHSAGQGGSENGENSLGHPEETVLPTESLKQLRALLGEKLADQPELAGRIEELTLQVARELFAASFELFCPVLMPMEEADGEPTLALTVHPGVIRGEDAPMGTYDIFEILDVSLEDCILSTENEENRQVLVRDMLIYTAQMLSEASATAANYARLIEAPGFIDDFLDSLRD